MPKEKIVVLMGSDKDFAFASRIGVFLQEAGFPVECEYEVASAHKTPKRLLDILQSQEKTGDNIVFITVAGLSDALSGIVAGNTRYPVIACPPDSEKYGWAKVFSSTMTPKGVAVAYVPEPENAALMALKILALSNPKLQEKIVFFRRKMEEKVYEAAENLKTKTEKGSK
ncbi:MAG: AIR carboxylase family protein [Candidatus Bathyarchaeia archaeon]